MSDETKPVECPQPGCRTEDVQGGVVIRKRDPHRCLQPEARRYDIGDVFICKDCSRKYVLKDDQREGPFWAYDT